MRLFNIVYLFDYNIIYFFCRENQLFFWCFILIYIYEDINMDIGIKVGVYDIIEKLEFKFVQGELYICIFYFNVVYIVFIVVLFFNGLNIVCMDFYKNIYMYIIY